MAAEVMVGSERRVLISGYGIPAPPPPPPPESLLGRLDQIDLRLRQLEDQRRPPSEETDDDDGRFVSEVRRGAPGQQHRRHHHSKSMPSALQQHAQLRGTLMDRLNLLESRIRQLSSELDGPGSDKGACGGGSSVRPAEDRAWCESPLMEPRMDPAAMSYVAGKPAPVPESLSAVQILQRGARQLHRTKSNSTKVKNLEEAKCACQDQKRKAARNRAAGRRWFTVGC